MARGGDAVSVYGVDEDGRGAELEVTAPGGEQTEGGLVILFGGQVGVLRAPVFEPPLESGHQLKCDAHSPDDDDDDDDVSGRSVINLI